MDKKYILLLMGLLIIGGFIYKNLNIGSNQSASESATTNAVYREEDLEKSI